MAKSLNTDQLGELLASLLRPESLIGLGILLGCLLMSWVVVRLVRGKARVPGSIWFGERIVDGVLFPVVALVLAYAARLLLADTVTAVVFRIAIPILLSLLAIRLTVRVLTASFPNSRWMRIFERSVSWLAWLAVVLWVIGVLPLLLDAMEDLHWKIGSARVSLRDVVEGLVTGAVVMMLALWASSAVERHLLRGTGSSLSVRMMVSNLLRVLLLFVGLLLTLSAVGIDLTALSVVGGAVGVGVGFGLQKIAANYVSGFVILAERSLRIGDMVKVDGFEGRISDIRTRYTVIRALNGRESIVPNEMLITQRIENSSLADPKVSLSTAVQVAYGTDVRALKARLEAVVADVPRVLSDPAPNCQLAEFAADGINLNIAFWVGDLENGQGNVRSDVNLAVLDLFNAEGVEIPFPQRVLHTPAPATPADPPIQSAAPNRP